jgi:hypothetical protein
MRINGQLLITEMLDAARLIVAAFRRSSAHVSAGSIATE